MHEDVKVSCSCVGSGETRHAGALLGEHIPVDSRRGKADPAQIYGERLFGICFVRAVIGGEGNRATVGRGGFCLRACLESA